jgi:hypothetical protein
LKKNLLILTWSLLAFLPSHGQKDDKLIQFSGVVRNEYLQPLQFVHILILNKHRGTISDTRGMFSFVVEPSDSIIFSAVGYKRTGVVIPDTLRSHYYPIDVIMESDTVEIREVIILPWKTYQEFKQAFITLELPDDDLQRAFHNLAMIHSQIHNPDAPPDPDINYQYQLREQFNARYSLGQTPYYSIFDPMRWAKFFEYLKQGKFKDPNNDR